MKLQRHTRVLGPELSEYHSPEHWYLHGGHSEVSRVIGPWRGTRVGLSKASVPIMSRTLADSKILIVGAGVLLDEIAQGLRQRGIQSITTVGTHDFSSGKGEQNIAKDPLRLAEEDPAFFKSFDLVLVANQPRAVELAISEIRWLAEGGGDGKKELPMMVMRNAENNCKMRCQYRELQIVNGSTARFVSLPEDLLPWTEEKRHLVRETMQDELNMKHEPRFRDYLSAALAVLSFHESRGAWPTKKDTAEVESHLPGRQHEAAVQDLIERFCNVGLAGVEESTLILSRLVITDAIKLLTGSGQPINNTNLDEVLRIMGPSSL